MDLDRSRIRLSVGLPLVAVIACAPVLTTRYGFVDDYSLLWQDEHGGNVASFGVGQGRPVGGLLLWLGLGGIDGISGLVVLRLISVLSYAAIGVVLGRAMISRGYSLVSAWVVGVGLFWLPSTAIMVSWSILFFGAVAALLGAVAGVLVVGFDEEQPRRLGATLVRPRSLLAFGLLCTAMMTYQPAAMVFWPCVFLLLAAPSRPLGWRPIILPVWTATVIGVAAVTVGFAAFKLGALVSSQSTTRAGFVAHPLGKIRYLFREVIPYGLYPWNLDVRLTAAACVALVLVVGLLISLPGGPVERLIMTALAGAAVTLGWFANIPIAESSNYSRTGVGVMVGQVVLVGVVLDGIMRRLSRRSHEVVAPTVVIAATVFAMVWMFSVLATYVTRPASQELSRVELAVRDLPDDEQVTVLPALPGTTLAPRIVFDEFGRSTGTVYWALQGITELAYRDVRGDWPDGEMFRYPSDEDYAGGRLREMPSEGGLVLDYQRILQDGGPPLYEG